MNRRLRTLTASAALVLAAALTLSACGDKDSDGAGAKAPSSSSSSSSDSAATLTQANFTSTITAAQMKARTSHVSMDLGMGGQSIKAEGDVKIGKDAAGTAMAMTMDMGSAGASTGANKIEMRLVDQIFYLNFGPMTQNKFAKIDLKDSDSAIGKQYGNLLDQMDPSKQLKEFDKAVTSFKKKGDPEKIDGVDAQPYELVLDTSKIASMAQLSGGAKGSVPKTLTYVMYVGSDNLPRRMATDVAGSKITVDYSKWGEPVEVNKPAASEISDQDLGATTS